MTDRNDTEYYSRRETQQRELAEKAQAPEIRKIHLDLADGYARRAGPATTRPTLSIAATA